MDLNSSLVRVYAELVSASSLEAHASLLAVPVSARSRSPIGLNSNGDVKLGFSPLLEHIQSVVTSMCDDVVGSVRSIGRLSGLPCCAPIAMPAWTSSALVTVDPPTGANPERGRAPAAGGAEKDSSHPASRPGSVPPIDPVIRRSAPKKKKLPFLDAIGQDPDVLRLKDHIRKSFDACASRLRERLQWWESNYSDLVTRDPRAVASRHDAQLQQGKRLDAQLAREELMTQETAILEFIYNDVKRYKEVQADLEQEEAKVSALALA
eukprot:GHVT01059758.1.p1 GENE.GHVT01059758.1~~GHVT01059758.1.p1  ORF type:complete len:265 (+),score=57.55 GHVT01059758.1:199-993(+)